MAIDLREPPAWLGVRDDHDVDLTVPAWMFGGPGVLWDTPCTCSADPQEFWAVPGVTGLGESTESGPSPAVAALAHAVEGLAGVDPTTMTGPQALVDAQVLLGLEQQLRVLDLRRVGDVAARGLHELAGFRTARTWLRKHRPDGDNGDVHLAAQLRDYGRLRSCVEGGTVPLVSARKVLVMLSRCAPHLDKHGELVDGQPGAELFAALVTNAFTFVCRDLLGLHDGDPRLEALVAEAKQLLAHEGSQVAWLEAIAAWLATHVAPRTLSKALEELELAVLPSRLEEKGDEGHGRRGLTLEPRADGTGWHVSGDLDLECGERLWTALRSEMSRDSANTQDTAAWQAGEKGRSRRERLHDALNRMLERYLACGLGGEMGKAPVQVNVTLSEATVTDQAGAPPPRADSGRMIPRSLVRRWWCDSSVTTYVMSLGGKTLRVIHGQRTLSAVERRGLATEGDGRCIGDGCCTDPLFAVTRPHHVLGYAEDQVTSLDETVPVCDTLHHDLHDGHRTVRLRDGRYLNEHGFVDGIDPQDHAPF